VQSAHDRRPAVTDGCGLRTSPTGAALLRPRCRAPTTRRSPCRSAAIRRSGGS